MTVPPWPRFGVQIPLDAAVGATIAGRISLAFAAGVEAATVGVSITVSAGDPLYDHGDADTWRMSRLRWLDSTIGSDDADVPWPYARVNHTATGGASHGPQSHLDAPYYILYGETAMKYKKARLNDSAAHGQHRPSPCG